MPRRSKGDGSISQRHDHPTCPPAVAGERKEHRCQGRWVGMLDLGWSAGKRQRRAVYGRTRKEVTIKLATLRDQHRTSGVVVGTPTVAVWMRYWLDVICPERGLKVNTMKSHRSKVETYIVPALGRHRLDKLQPEHVRAMYAQMRRDGLAEATLRQTHAILRRALEVAVRERKVPYNVAAMIDPPSVEKKKRMPLSLDDARQVLSVGGLRWQLALWAGLRQGEVLALRWSDIDLERRAIHVRRSLVRVPGQGLDFTEPKSRKSRREVPMVTPIHARLTVAYAEHLANGGRADELVFSRKGHPIDHRADWQEWSDLLAGLGIEHVALHAARNTTATLLDAAGVPPRVVADILGHTQTETTEGYQTIDFDRLTSWMTTLERYVLEDGGTPRALPSSPEDSPVDSA